MVDDKRCLVLAFTDSTLELALCFPDKEPQKMVLNFEQARFLKEQLSENEHLISTKDGE